MNWEHSAFDDLGYNRILKFIAEYCLSDLGEERVLRLSPMDDAAQIRLRISRVDQVVRLLEEEGSFPLQRITDIRESLNHARIENAFLDPDRLLAVAKNLEVSRVCLSFLQEHEKAIPQLFELGNSLTPHKNTEVLITSKIDEHGSVKDDASDTLRQIRRNILKQEASIREQMESLTRQFADAGMLQEGRATIRGGRLVMPVKSGYKNRVKGIVHDQSASGQTYFIEPMAIVEGNNRLKELHLAEREEVERILRQITAEVGAIADDISENQAILVRLDVLHAMALYGQEIKGVPPGITTDHFLDLRDARNPVLMKTRAVVPNTITFGDDHAIILITGPNAGGKTVTLKTAGLLTLMALTGMFIPAREESTVPVVDAIFVDIGDRQSLENDLSTFSSHIERIGKIIEHATSNSLVLLDELGTGTDPTEGAALARAILESLLEIGTLGIATTHHGALKAFAHNTPGILNGAMQFNQQDLSPTYSLQLGRPGSSYALDIAGRVGLSQRVITLARDYLDTSKEALEDLIVKLEQEVEGVQQQKSELTLQKQKFENLKHEYEVKVEKIRDEVKKAKKTASDEAQKILNESSARIEEAIRNIREADASTESIKSAKAVVEEQKERIAGIRDEVTEKPVEEGRPLNRDELQEGDYVFVVQFNRVGKITAEPGSNRRIPVEVNGKKMEVPLKMLREPTEDQLPNRSGNTTATSGTGTRVHLSDDQTTSPRIDIRGQRADEAYTSLERFYNRALVQGLHQLEIIHGKGTGVLQNVVDEFLSQQKQVKEHRYGELEEGGTGVTIVELE